MIIDIILNRKDSDSYKPSDFYWDILGYGKLGDDITRAMDYGTEKEVKEALCKFIVEQYYNPAICDYINSVNWLENEVNQNA